LADVIQNWREGILHSHFGDHDVRGFGFKKLTPTKEALRILLASVPSRPPKLEIVPLMSSIGRVLGSDIVSDVNIPPFDRAAMDGYAVKAEDTFGATTAAPVFLRLIGRVSMQDPKTIQLRGGEAASVVTGARMPVGADAVVMVEHSKRLGDGTVEVSEEVHPNENVAKTGEDVKAGAVVLRRGTTILPQDLGILTALGVREVQVARKPRVGVLSTGSELRDEPESTSDRIADVNRPILKSAVEQFACEPVDLGIVPDDFDEIRKTLTNGIKTCDILLVTAGTSVGPGDIVPRVIDSLGRPGMLVHGVGMRPSMPTGLAVVDEKPIISLPGYPVSAYIAFLEFFPAIASHLLGTDFLPRPKVRARLSRRVAGVLGSRTYIRVLVRTTADHPLADPVRTSGAGILSSLVQANGFIIVPEHVEGYEEGELVEVELFRPVERREPAN